jgi:two-component system sensor histidine kinase CpxA
MRSLFFKIFIIFWIAQSLIFVISTALIVRRHFESPDVLFDGLYSSLQNDARQAAAAYQSGGCGALHAYGVSLAQTIALDDAAGQPLCAAAGMALPSAGTGFPARTTGSQAGQQYIWRVPVVSADGKRYVFLLSRPHVPRNNSWHQDLLHFSFPQLPVAIVIGGFTTFVLVLLFTRPVARLRKAARELATGKLNARVAWPAAQSPMFEGDEISGLIHDFNHMAERLVAHDMD